MLFGYEEPPRRGGAKVRTINGPDMAFFASWRLTEQHASKPLPRPLPLRVARHFQGLFRPPGARGGTFVAGAVGFAGRLEPVERIDQRVAGLGRWRRAERASVGVAPGALVLALERRRPVAVAAGV